MHACPCLVCVFYFFLSMIAARNALLAKHFDCKVCVLSIVEPMMSYNSYDQSNRKSRRHPILEMKSNGQVYTSIITYMREVGIVNY